MPDAAADRVTIATQVDPAYADAVDVEALEAVVHRALAVAAVEDEVEVSIVVTSDEVVQELNRTYRGQDKTTDVLSFGQEGDGPPLPPGLPRLLGDVVVAYPQVVAQAARAGWSPADELAWLVIHGLLHLVGYDDEEETGRATMWSLGEQALGRRAPGGPAEE